MKSRSQFTNLDGHGSILEANPLDAYVYLLSLLGKSDAAMEFPTDITLLVVASPGCHGCRNNEQDTQCTCTNDIGNASGLIEIVERLAVDHGGVVPSPSRKAKEILAINNVGRLRFSELVYVAGFGEPEQTNPGSIWKSICDSLADATMPCRVAFARHAYAAVQLLAASNAAKIARDPWFDTACLSRGPDPVALV